MQQLSGRSLSPGIASGQIVVFDPLPGRRTNIDRNRPVIIAARGLTPKDTVGFRKESVAAFIVENGADNSHVAILARAMGKPAIAGVHIDPTWDGCPAIINGETGGIVIEPDEGQFTNFLEQKKLRARQEIHMRESYSGKPTSTRSGRKIDLLANITSPADIQSVLDSDAEGIGNFKTEFMLLDRTSLPDEQEQFEIYKELACAMGDRLVVIRTFDIGVDKVPEYVEHTKEENPALGYRAIRLCLDHPEIFIPQLRAILRASAYGNVAIMYPFVISVDEVRKIKDIMREIMADLKNQHVSFNENIEQGIMIETPASVIMSRELAQVVDFFSIGTNDLTQYTLAIDRNNPSLGNHGNAYHQAILRSIEYVIKNAHAENIWVSISGELGSDTSMTEFFLDCGLDALTVSPGKILNLRKTICDL